jgi:gluconolactonase
MKAVLLLFSTLFSLCCFAQQTVESIERLDDEINLLIDADAAIEILADGFSWSEGPVWVPQLNAVLFTDVPENKLYRWDEANGLSVFLDPSGYTGYAPNEKKAGGNGLILDPKGNLLIAQHGDRRIARVMAPLDKPGAFTTVVDRFEGKRFHSPNDLILHSNGDLYFTDPPYGLKGDDDLLRELQTNGVYRLNKAEGLSLVYEQLNRPNGLALSPDEKTLYVANSDTKRNLWMAFDLVNGQFLNERVFFDATSIDRPGLADGMKVNKEGYVFATGPGGVLIFNPQGKHLGTILTPERTANCAFNEDESVLYMTSHHYLTRIQLKK